MILAAGLAAVGGIAPGQLAPFRPARHRVHTAARPVQQVGPGQLFEHDAVQPIPHPGLLPGAQPPPGRLPGPAAQLRGRSRQRQPVRSTNRIPSSASRSSIHGRPPWPGGRGRAGSSGWISSQSRSSMSRCCRGVTTERITDSITKITYQRGGLRPGLSAYSYDEQPVPSRLGHLTKTITAASGLHAPRSRRSDQPVHSTLHRQS